MIRIKRCMLRLSCQHSTTLQVRAQPQQATQIQPPEVKLRQMHPDPHLRVQARRTLIASTREKIENGSVRAHGVIWQTANRSLQISESAWRVLKNQCGSYHKISIYAENGDTRQHKNVIWKFTYFIHLSNPSIRYQISLQPCMEWLPIQSQTRTRGEREFRACCGTRVQELRALDCLASGELWLAGCLTGVSGRGFVREVEDILLGGWKDKGNGRAAVRLTQREASASRAVKWPKRNYRVQQKY